MTVVLARFPYKRVLREVYKHGLVALPTLLEAPLTDLTFIDFVALDAWECQWLPVMPDGEEWSDWNWRIAMSGRSPPPSKRFELSIWSNDDLCGLAFGAPSQRRQNLTIRALQGSPVANHPLKGKILPIVNEVASMYATTLGCQELRFSQPIPEIIPFYERLGFRLARPQKHVVYCVRSLRIGEGP
jgi:hypothetical protein